MVELFFLGTSEATPTKEKGQTAVLLRYKNENILVDCGEGTQRQFKMMGLNPCSITRILITHWHGDHILGLPGLIQTLGLNNYGKTLYIYGPRGTKKFMSMILGMFMYFNKVKIEVKEIDSGVFFENKEFKLEAIRMKHGAPCLAYSFSERERRRIKPEFVKKVPGVLLGQLQRGKNIKFNGKSISSSKATYIISGKKITFILDTLYNENCIKIAKDSDILISESTFLASAHPDKASEREHLTSEQAGLIAKRAKVKKLFLTHISQRYAQKNEQQKILDEAKKVFKNSELAKDFMKIVI